MFFFFLFSSCHLCLSFDHLITWLSKKSAVPTHAGVFQWPRLSVLPPLCSRRGGDFHGFFLYRTLFLLGSFTFQVVKRHTVDGSEIRQTQPVELGTLSHDFRGFIHPRCLGMGRISSINSRVVNQPLVLLPKVRGISGQHPQCHSQKIRPYVIFKDYWGNNDGLQIPGYQGRLFLGPLDSFFAKGL